MRQIKFRAWDKASKSMMDLAEPAYREGFGQIIMYAPRPIENGFELMQFTGILDANGREIYENDVLKGMAGTGNKGLKSTKEKELLFVVKWSSYTHSWYLDVKNYGNYRFFPSFQSCLVVGNIYENPELLT